MTISLTRYGSMKIPKNMLKITLFLLNMFIITSVDADNRIIIRLAHAPAHAIEQSYIDAQKEKLIEKFDALRKKTPSYMSQQLIKNNLKNVLRPELSGFMAIYGGYSDISDPDGIISFPLRHASPKLYIALTSEIKLIEVKGKTFSHGEYITDPNVETELYSYEKKQDNKKQLYWEVRKISLPPDKKINPITIVIFSKPKNIFIKTGNIMATETKQLIAPEIYVVGNDNKESLLLKLLDIKNYFEPVMVQKKKASENTLQKIITNF